jgi:hypothetical protein
MLLDGIFLNFTFFSILLDTSLLCSKDLVSRSNNRQSDLERGFIFMFGFGVLTAEIFLSRYVLSIGNFKKGVLHPLNEKESV